MTKDEQGNIIDPKPGVKPKASLYGDTHRVYSTGKLEACQAAGNDVYVLHGLPVAERDAWWVAMLDATRIVPMHLAESIESAPAMDAMHELYDKLKLPWDDSLSSWHSAFYALPGLGVKLGCQMKTEPLAA